MLHDSTFEYLNPRATQLEDMNFLRQQTAEYARVLQENIPDGPDKTYILRKLRELAMWINVAITREADGTPR